MLAMTFRGNASQGANRRVQTSVGGGRGADAHRFVGLAHERHSGVDVGMHRDRADAERLRGADDAARDLAAVGDQKRGDHGVHPVVRAE